jgi:hypothetical protein
MPVVMVTQTGASRRSLRRRDAGLNDRAPHLTRYGSSHLLAARDTSTATGDLTPTSANRKLYVQVLDSTTGAAVSTPIPVAVTNNRYQEMKPFPQRQRGLRGSAGTQHFRDELPRSQRR